MKFLNFFYFCGSILPSWIWIWIPNSDTDRSTDLIESGSNPNPGSETFVLIRGNRKAKSGDSTCRRVWELRLAWPDPTRSRSPAPHSRPWWQSPAIWKTWDFHHLRQCSGFMTFWCEFGTGSRYFRHWLSRRQQKTNIKKSFSAYYRTYFLKVRSHHFSKIKFKRNKTVGIKVFLTIFACWKKDPDPEGPKTCGPGGSGPLIYVISAISNYSLCSSVVDCHRLDAIPAPDLDLQHCFAAHKSDRCLINVAFKILGQLKERTSRSRRLNRENIDVMKISSKLRFAQSYRC